VRAFESAALILRRGRPADAVALSSLINHYARQGGMLPRTPADIREHCGDFLVAEANGKILGCGALKAYNRGLAEVRSLCTAPEAARRGVGRALLQRLVEEASHRGFKTLFALTVVPQFFARCGFREVHRLALPLKIWRDCLHCPKLFRCDERAMVLELTPGSSQPDQTPAEARQPSPSLRW
jgi:amino-acid N-acetyltransferase